MVSLQCILRIAFTVHVTNEEVGRGSPVTEMIKSRPLRLFIIIIIIIIIKQKLKAQINC